ncbi:MAG TPA: hypothetical protein VKF36_14330 [Syntrophorhabdales bacterium]|nr:hypothetical protein [Syntrophorhabdales bacterium]
MGHYSYQKEVYDFYTAEHFAAQGYETEILSGSFADILAWHVERKEIAIIEVKSPAEKYAGVEWETKHNVKKKSRREVLDLLRGSRIYYHYPGLVRLYAFAISSQLFSYYKEARQYLRKRVKDGTMGNRECLKGCHIIPYLSVPVERREVLEKVLTLLKKRRLTRGFGLQETERVAVARITY